MSSSMCRSKNRKKFSSMCRLCMEKGVSLVNLHPKNGKVKHFHDHYPSNILDLIEIFTTVKIDPLDNLPQKICESCIQTIDSMLAFRNKCKQSNEELHKMKILDTEEESELSLEHDKPKSENTDVIQAETSSQPDTDATGIRRSRSEKVACHICGRLYGSSSLKYHLNQHNGLKPFECDEVNCTSKFAAPHDLKKHKERCHSLDLLQLFFCDICGKGFKTKTKLVNHMSYHFDPKLPCKICGKLLRNKIALGKHMLVHSQERKFRCDICGKSYQTGYTLRIHKRVHTQEKPYPCHCGMSFAYKCLLKTHEDKYHKGETQHPFTNFFI